ncbi:MAG: hypothetical protein IJ091_00030 [Oscillospiraceae bacterium]|nr:hypothetical protein [Oscillospiraceae bacterium]
MIMPVIAGIATGAVARLCYEGLDLFLPGRIATLGSLMVAVLFYAVLTVKIGILTRESLSSIPKGEKIAGILERVGLFK